MLRAASKDRRLRKNCFHMVLHAFVCCMTIAKDNRIPANRNKLSLINGLTVKERKGCLALLPGHLLSSCIGRSSCG